MFGIKKSAPDEGRNVHQADAEFYISEFRVMPELSGDISGTCRQVTLARSAHPFGRFPA